VESFKIAKKHDKTGKKTIKYFLFGTSKVDSGYGVIIKVAASKKILLLDLFMKVLSVWIQIVLSITNGEKIINYP
jgi:hypothetical protein